MIKRNIDDPLTMRDLQPFMTQIKNHWHLGDQQIIADASRALLRILHASAKRLRRNGAPSRISLSKNSKSRTPTELDTDH